MPRFGYVRKIWVEPANPSPSKQKDDELIEAKKEILKLRSDLKRTEEERDILKKAERYFANQPE
ncbi:hypothetical protein IG389_02400 [Idiomarina abyssalis]|uniref:Transposase n=1 Tax=Idiomarina abyssalis TaxID=86102 RepID=A0A8I1G5J2_9GAMM|nr:hypothetical protein [Idiomarina abyssalis]MBJ7272769.1 hypothetical protein [Idiomarina abyssalis]MBJ7316313.1 hypothetical protein [Idiomarina abyssalis]